MTAAAPSSTPVLPRRSGFRQRPGGVPCSAARARSNCHPWAEDSWLEEMALSTDPQTPASCVRSRHLGHQTWPYQTRVTGQRSLETSRPRACKGLLAPSSRVQDVQLFCSGTVLPVPLTPGPLHTWDQATQLSQRQPWAPGHTGRRYLSHGHHFKGVFCRQVLWSPGHQVGKTLVAWAPAETSAHWLTSLPWTAGTKG